MTTLASLKGIEELSNAVGAFAGSDQSAITVRLLDLMDRQYIEQLIEAETTRVVELQHFIRQARALRAVLAGKGGTPSL